MKRQVRWIVWGGLGAVLLVFLIWAFRPAPVPVDLGTVTSGTLTVTVDEEARTRIRDIYVLSAPVGGRVLRIDAEPGDPVLARETVIATILPTDPSFLDARSLGEAEAAVHSAEAALALAEAELERARAEYTFAQTELTRARELRTRGTISEAALDRANLDLRSARANRRTAEATVEVRSAELDSARARLVNPEGNGSEPTGSGIVTVRSPVNGRVLQVRQESESVVLAGTPLADVGDPETDLEILCELLSTDAVKVAPGARVIIDDWGGDRPLRGEVERVEPFGFTKFSALGVEEQRVNVIIQFLDPPEDRLELAHGFRVEARIVTWEGDDVLRVPASALFRAGSDWAVFTVERGRARLRVVEIGQRTAELAQVVSGLEPEDSVVLFPSDRITDGVAVTAR